MKNKKGFTLIELLVVIAIIGLLSTLAVVSLNGARSKARDAKRTSDLRAVQSALELYRADNNDSFSGITTLTWAGISTALQPYLTNGLPLDPGTPNLYAVCINPATTVVNGLGNYLLHATLENNIPPGAGVIGIPTWLPADCKDKNGDIAVMFDCNNTTGFCLGDIKKQ